MANLSPILTVGLVGCSKTKLDRPAPARELYCSDLFREAAEYCAHAYDAWYVLSARYGLLDPETNIEPYDLTLNAMSRPAQRAWADSVYYEMSRAGLLPGKIYFHAGLAYRRFLIDRIDRCFVPLAGLGIGKQVAWYKSRRPARD
jgi:hypothetical protein